MDVPLRSQKKRTDRKSLAMRTEKDLATKLGGVAQPGSGAGLRHKGDVKTQDALIDSKETEGNSILVTGAMLSQITAQARREQKYPALCLKIGVMPGALTPKQWMVIPIDTYLDLVEASNGQIT